MDAVETPVKPEDFALPYVASPWVSAQNRWSIAGDVHYQTMRHSNQHLRVFSSGSEINRRYNKIMSSVSKFAVRNMYIKYSFTKNQNISDAYCSLRKALGSLFGDGYSQYGGPAVIVVPTGSDFVEIDTALYQEFKKYPALKGMRFQLQLCRDMLTVT